MATRHIAATSAVSGADQTRERKSRIWKRDDLDFYIEPEWTSERLFDVEKFEGRIRDPACGSGRIVESAFRAFYYCVGTDIAPRRRCYLESDFFMTEWCEPNVVCNPPFKVARAFVAHALKLCSGKVAMLLPYRFMYGDDQAQWLATTPLRRVWALTPRPSMPPGEVVLSGGKVGGGTVDFAWFVYEHGFQGHPELRWLRRDGK